MLEINTGDFAFGPNGEMIRREDGTYSVYSGPDRVPGLSKEQIEDTLKDMQIPLDGWTSE